MVPITWELLIAIFFIVIAAYSFIIGRDKTVKVIVATYIGILASNAIGNLAKDAILQTASRVPFLKLTPEENLVIFKITLFVIVTLGFVLRGGFDIKLRQHTSVIINFFATGMYGILSAGLIISTILVFVSGQEFNGLLSELAVSNPIVIKGTTIYFDSFIKNHNIWFALPALMLLLSSLLNKEEEPLQ